MLVDSLMDVIESMSSSLISDIRTLMEAKEKEVREMQYNVEDLIHKAEKKELVFNTAIGE